MTTNTNVNDIITTNATVPTVKIRSEAGDAGIVFAQLKKLVRDWKSSNGSNLEFTIAEIRFDINKFKNDVNDPSYYPLRLYAKGGIVVWASEFRTGYHGYSSKKLIECLRYFGFNVTKANEEAIYNNGKLSLTLWKEEAVKQF